MFGFGKPKQKFMEWSKFVTLSLDDQLKYIDELGEKGFADFLRHNFSDAEIQRAVQAAKEKTLGSVGVSDNLGGVSASLDIAAIERELGRFEEMTGFPMPVKERTFGECEHGHRHPVIVLDITAMADLNGKLEAVMELGLDEVRKIVADTQQSANRAILSARRPPARSND